MRQHTVLQRVTAALLCLLLTTPASAFVPSELQTAAEELLARGIMVGDPNGDMRLASSLTRAELAVVLSRLNSDPATIETNQLRYISLCKFLDVPEWARLYVGYCRSEGLMTGYSPQIFGPNDFVTPAAACTVALQLLELSEAAWDYTTACQKALELGLISEEIVEKDGITRGDLAILLYRTLGTAQLARPEGTEITGSLNSVITPPADVSRYVPQAGDTIRCDDGTDYTITDVSRYGLDPYYSDGRLPAELPAPACNWSRFQEPELPAMEVRRFQTAGGDMLFIRNLYESRRMQYTLYNLIGAAGSEGRVAALSIDWEQGVGEFWPWRDSEIEKVFQGRPDGTYYIEAWDCYKDGVFQHTRYRLDIR